MRPDPLPWPEVDAALEVIKHALDAGQIGNGGLLSTEQQSFKGICEEFNVWLWNNLPPEHEVRRQWRQIIEAQPQPGPIRMVNVQRPSALE